MGLGNDFRSEREKLKNANTKQKLQFFWDYYKWVVIVGLIVIAVVISFVYPAIESKDVVLSGICLNSYQSSFETSYDVLIQDFLTAQGLDPDDCTMELTAGMIYDPDNQDAAEINYQSIQRIGAQITMGGLDVMIGNLGAMQAFADSGSFYELSEVLPQELMERYEPHLIPGVQGNWILIDVSGCDQLMENYPYLSEPLVLGIAVNAPNREMIVELIAYLLQRT